jgi:hypothetical protein
VVGDATRREKGIATGTNAGQERVTGKISCSSPLSLLKINTHFVEVLCYE